jgi:nucleotide-binding universal stress UspA family protein
MIALSSRGAGAIRHALVGSVAARLIGSSGLPVLTAGPLVGRTRKARQYKILATIDDSTASRDVLDAIGSYIERSSMKLFLLRVCVPTLGDRGERAEMADCRKQLRELRNELAPGVSARAMVSHLEGLDRLDSVILQAAEKIGANAIAMSTYGHSAGRHLLVGSTALGVLARSRSPLILARAERLPDDEPTSTGSSDAG